MPKNNAVLEPEKNPFSMPFGFSVLSPIRVVSCVIFFVLSADNMLSVTSVTDLY